MPRSPKRHEPRGKTPPPPEQRGSARERGYTTAWDKARMRYLSEHPLCVECEKMGRLVPAVVVDHITPHRQDYQLFWDEANWQGLCVPHHNAKTARGE